MMESADDPKQTYARRLAMLRAVQAERMRRDKTLGFAKLVLFLALIVLCGWLAKFDPTYLFFALIPVLALVFLIVLHERVLRSLRQCNRVIALYERGMARLEDRWAGSGETGEVFLAEAHPYARDLDIFGPGSVFQLLCTVRTRTGEQTLADWLLFAAPQTEIRARQAAVEELRTRLQLREDLATTGEDVRAGVHPEALAAWGEDAAMMKPGGLRVVTMVLAVLWLASGVLWAWKGQSIFFFAMCIVNLTVTGWLHKRVQSAAAGVESAAHDLELLAKILACMEREKFSTEKLLGLQAQLRTEGETAASGVTASRAIGRLSRAMQWLESADNIFVRILNPFVFWTAQCAFVMETWRMRYGAGIRGWLAAVGEMEALSALAVYGYEHPEYIFPEFVAEGPRLEATDFAHPLMPRDRAVANDLDLNSELQLLMISGPNMAGKSTFIRGVGVNVVLAQCGAPVRAKQFVLSSLAVTASICVLDSLQGGISRFYAEIRRLKQISDLAEGPTHVLFLLDELLSGTNSHDRQLGTELMVKGLVQHGAIGLVTTHDLALTEIASAMGGHAANVHFADRFEEGELRFDYKLHPGIVQTSNALQLMRSIGLKV
ncbi:MAG TPA: mismatch repair protein [Acidobacteriaceae bacterium]|jgi:hypothetical protein|nr:mismatch repair protein [Acidobacteriaceae bacterium]